MDMVRNSSGIILRYLFIIFFLSRFFSLPIAGRLYSVCSICVSLYIMVRYVIQEMFVMRRTRIKVDIITFIIVVFIFIQAVITVLQGGSLYSVLAHMYPVLATTCFINMSISRHPKELVKAYTIYTFIILIANFLDMVLFSDISMEWGRIVTKSFLIGGITGFGMQYSLVLMFLLLYKDMNNNILSNMLLLVSLAIIIVTTAIVKTATTYICVVLNLLILFVPFGLKLLGKIKSYIIYAVYALVWITIVISRRFSVFQYVITEVFHRNLTLTHRTEIWDTAMREMTGRWLMGYGAQNTGNVIQIDIGLFSLHNQVFQLIYEGGIALIIIFSVVFFVCTSRKKSRYHDRRREKTRAIIMSAIIVCLVNMLAEAPGLYEFFFLLVFYSKSEYLVSMDSYKREQLVLQ